MVKKILSFFERKAFGVCEWWGNKLGISVGTSKSNVFKAKENIKKMLRP